MQDLFSQLYSQVLAPEIPPLTEEHQQLLQQHSIDENSPGTILRDFQTLLDFLHPNGTQVSGIHNLFPLKSLPELNSRLSHPIETNLKRPQQKSYPYINGLYLLLRASGLSQVKQLGKKQTLVLDEAVLQSWTKLNLTERYFTLLEAWMILGNEEILGERYDPIGNLMKCLRFWPRIPDKGLKLPNILTKTNSPIIQEFTTSPFSIYLASYPCNRENQKPEKDGALPVYNACRLAMPCCGCCLQFMAKKLCLGVSG
jgi:hypothetical protein